MGEYQLRRCTFKLFFISYYQSRDIIKLYPFIAQLVEHGTGIAEVTTSNPVEALIFVRLLLSNCLNWKIYCDDHSSLSRDCQGN